MRTYILIRDKYRCTRCGGSGALEVHHIQHLTPDNIHDGSVTLNEKNLATLCRNCHFEVHAQDKLEGGKKYNAEHAGRADCDAGFAFDSDGYLVPVKE